MPTESLEHELTLFLLFSAHGILKLPAKTCTKLGLLCSCGSSEAASEVSVEQSASFTANTHLDTIYTNELMTRMEMFS